MVTYFIARDRQKYIPYLPVYLTNMQQLELTHQMSMMILMQGIIP